MRPKVVLIVLALGIVAVWGLWLLRGRFTGTGDQAVGPESGASRTPASDVGPSRGGQLGTGGGIPGVAHNVTDTTGSTADILATTPEQDTMLRRQKELEVLQGALAGTVDEGVAFGVVLSRLADPDAEVRAAARDTAVHMGDTNFVPHLNELMAKTRDPREKVALLDAIEYLELPSEVPQVDTNAALPRVRVKRLVPKPDRNRAPPPGTKANE